MKFIKYSLKWNQIKQSYYKFANYLMFEFNIVNIFPPIAALAVNELFRYIKRKNSEKRAEKMGDIIDSINTSSFNPENKFMMYGLGVIGVLWATAGIIVGIKNSDFYIASKGLSYGLLLIFLPKRWKNTSSIFICKNGIYSYEFQITWQELDRLEWDKDINQKNWGLKFYKKNQTSYHKIYINRKLKVEFENRFQNFLK